MAATNQRHAMTEKKTEREAGRRARRKENGMAVTAGISRAHRGEDGTRSMSLLRAALALWEAKHGGPTRSAWNRHRAIEAE